ncbi:DUF1430 domain-containing protein [Paenibacillus pabuli]|uniref:DUF1430 domain-containing protein n=1 Tax=Paenibacillus pabuli TaxID=1472 RepID=UPI003CF8D6AC
MKRLVTFFILLTCFISFYTSYNVYDQQEIERVYGLDQQLGSEFFIPDNLVLSNPDEIYPILLNTSTKMHVNIMRPAINNKPDQQIELVKYILLNGETSFFDAFKLGSGRVLNDKDTLSTTMYMSTSTHGDQNQVGVIEEFGGNDTITIRTLKSSYNYLPVSGYYYLEADQTVLNTFLEKFSQNLNNHYSQQGLSVNFSPNDFTNTTSPKDSYKPSPKSDVKTLSYILMFINGFFVLYYSFKETKRVAVYKLIGFSTIRIWTEVIGKNVTFIFALSAGFALFLFLLVPHSSILFFYFLIYEQVKLFLIVVISTIPALIYMNYIKISDAIKNRNKTFLIFLINVPLKIVTTIVVMFLFSVLVSQYNAVKNEEYNLRNWKESSGFGVFYPVNQGYDAIDFQNGAIRFIRATAGQLYPVLNELGSLLINSRQYEETALLLDKDYSGFRSLQVNTNYLREFPVYDNSGKPILISDQETSWIILVPEQFKNQEDEIVHFFKDEREQRSKFEKEQLQLEIPVLKEQQNIQIIWSANHQNIFSFNPDVNPKNNNTILDPIIQVVTEKNSLLGDRDAILGGGSTDPMKVKLLDGDTAGTYSLLEPTLKEYQLDDNLHYLITVDQYIAEKLYHLQKQLYSTLVSLIISVIIFCLLMIQHLSILFSKFQQKFIMRGLFGLSDAKKYKEFILFFSIIWGSASIGIYVLGLFDSLLTIVIVIALIILELCFSVAWLTRISRKHAIKMLKGGH